MFTNWKIGFRYRHGKVLIYKDNPGEDFPGWAVDIREIIAMVFVGIASICLLFKGDTDNAMVLLVGLLAYATGRTVPGGVKIYPKEATS